VETKETAVAQQPWGIDMAHYRAYAVKFDGNFDGYESLNCDDDAEAIGEAQRLANNSAIELWTGERFVARMECKSSRNREQRRF
jgi:hypothetical protein